MVLRIISTWSCQKTDNFNYQLITKIQSLTKLRLIAINLYSKNFDHSSFSPGNHCLTNYNQCTWILTLIDLINGNTYSYLD